MFVDEVEIKVEAGKKSKIDKIVNKLVPVIYILRYIGADALKEKLEKYGIKFDHMPTLD